MTPKEKAEELLSKMEMISGNKLYAKSNALICVDEIIYLNVSWIPIEVHRDYPRTYTADRTREYWIEVKQNLKAMQ